MEREELRVGASGEAPRVRRLGRGPWCLGARAQLEVGPRDPTPLRAREHWRVIIIILLAPSPVACSVTKSSVLQQLRFSRDAVHGPALEPHVRDHFPLAGTQRESFVERCSRVPPVSIEVWPHQRVPCSGTEGNGRAPLSI